MREITTTIQISVKRLRLEPGESALLIGEDGRVVAFQTAAERAVMASCPASYRLFAGTREELEAKVSAEKLVFVHPAAEKRTR